MSSEPVNMVNPIHLNRAARGMHACLQGCLPAGVQVSIVDNTIQFIYNGATIQVLADAYWRDRTLACWSVSIAHPQQTVAWADTSSGDRALIHVGMAMRFAESLTNG